MDREKMIEDVVGDMRDWLKRDAESFWDHIEDLERAYLRSKSDRELKDIHESSM